MFNVDNCLRKHIGGLKVEMDGRKLIVMDWAYLNHLRESPCNGTNIKIRFFSMQRGTNKQESSEEKVCGKICIWIITISSSEVSLLGCCTGLSQKRTNI